KALPGKIKPGEWYSLDALHVKVYNSTSGQVELTKNFTLYSDSLFDQIREVYFQFEEATLKGETHLLPNLQNRLAALLIEGYETLAKTPYTSALGKKLYYPSFLKIFAEGFYVHYPLTLLCMIGYAFSLGFFTLSMAFKKHRLFFAAFFI